MIVENAIEDGMPINVNSPNTERAAQILHHVKQYAKDTDTKDLVFALHRFYNFFPYKINHSSPFYRLKQKLRQIGELRKHTHPEPNTLCILPIPMACNELLYKYYQLRKTLTPIEAFQKLHKEQLDMSTNRRLKREKQQIEAFKIKNKQKEIIDHIRRNSPDQLKHITDQTLVALQKLTYIITTYIKNKKYLSEDLSQYISNQELANLKEIIKKLSEESLSQFFDIQTEDLSQIIYDLSNNKFDYKKKHQTSQITN